MGETTKIEWTDATWNPWVGCTKVSPGCAHCYAERLINRLHRGNPGGHSPFTVLRRTAPATFDAPLRWARRLPRASDGGYVRRVFTCSLSDFFHPAADPWRREAWLLMQRTPGLTYQILTKRPERIAANLPTDWGPNGWPNVWLGTSIETDDYRGRIEELVKVPARLRFLSVEPLLGPLHLSPYLFDIGWVIVGGESGPHARKMDLDWARTVRDDCIGMGVPFFFKQLGGAQHKRDGVEALLDGRTHKEVPRP